MGYYSEEEKNLFFNYDRKYYEEEILKNKENNCCKCKNYKTGNCILLEMMVTFSYVCPHFIKRDENILDEYYLNDMEFFQSLIEFMEEYEYEILNIKRLKEFLKKYN